MRRLAVELDVARQWTVVRGLLSAPGPGIANIFLQSSALQFAISAIGVLVFAGLTAYDTQQIKDNYYAVAGDAAAAGRAGGVGAGVGYPHLAGKYLRRRMTRAQWAKSSMYASVPISFAASISHR